MKEEELYIMTALILGIIAAICTGLSFIPTVSFLGFVGLVLAIIAWVIGAKAVKANPADGQSKAGKIIGMIITILAIISIIVGVVLAAALVGTMVGAMM